MTAPRFDPRLSQIASANNWREAYRLFALKGSGGATFIGRTSTAADPTTTELPADGDFGLHKNTASGTVFFAYNDGGVIKKATLA